MLAQDQYAGSIAVKAVRELGITRTPHLPHRINQAKFLPAAAMHRQPGGLVQNQKIRVFKQHRRLHPLAPKRWHCLHLTLPSGNRWQTQRVARADTRFRFDPTAIQTHLAPAQHLINAALRQRRIQLAQKIIEPLAAIRRRYRYKMHLRCIHHHNLR